ncbi:MAG: type II toxin-antitoxin system HicA family toxin [Cyanobacteriota bacterium]
MPKSPRLTAKEVIRLLKQNGFIEVSQTGSHLKLFNPNYPSHSGCSYSQ